MRTLLITVVCGLLLLGMAGSAAASGFLDEMFLSSEWWAGEEQQGEVEVFVLGTYGLEEFDASYHFSARQATGQGAVFVVNGNLSFEELLVLNVTAKFGTPVLYYGFGGLVGFTKGEKLVFLPRINLGGKLGPEFVKLVLDVDFYTLLLVNAGKFELGMEFTPLTNLRFYGGMLRWFTGTLVTSELLPGTAYQITAKYQTKPFYLGGEAYFSEEGNPIVLGEAGVNFSFVTLYGRMVVPSQNAEESGVYTIGVRMTY